MCSVGATHLVNSDSTCEDCLNKLKKNVLCTAQTIKLEQNTHSLISLWKQGRIVPRFYGFWYKAQKNKGKST